MTAGTVALSGKRTLAVVTDAAEFSGVDFIHGDRYRPLFHFVITSYSIHYTKLYDTRTEQVMTPGRISSYQSWSRGGFDYPYSPAPHYRHWGSYYNRCCSEVIYEPPRNNFV